jgi:hypothetical protein
MSELFPELDDAAPSASPAKPEQRPQEADAERVYSEAEARIARPGLAAGVDALTRFEQAFGLPGALRSLKKTAGDQIELVVELPDGKVVSASLVPPGVQAWKQGKSFGLSYRGPSLPPVVAKALLRFLARYDGVPFERILAQVIPDPGDEHMLSADYPESVFYAFAPASGWRRFFEGVDLYRGACATHTGNVAIIDHTDIECRFNNAPYDSRMPGFFNIPETEYSSGESNASNNIRNLFTDVQDRDVIRGADKLLDQALLNLADDPKKPEMVFIHAGCLADVTGDDLEASAARTASKLRLPVVVVGNQNDPVSTALSKLMDSNVITPERPLEPGGVALLGLPEFVGRRTLHEQLERAGINVLVSVLPNLDHNALELLARAELLVGYPWERYRETARRLAARMVPARAIEPGVPFGLEGTMAWLRAIGEAVGRSEAVEGVIAQELAAIEPSWSALSARARRYRVGFVIDQPNWRSALDPARSLGVPMLPMLREMGFGVDVLIYDPGGARHEAREAGVRVRSFRTCVELDALLREPETVLWYSEMLYERRVTRTGNSPFSLRQFRMGMQGALHSLRELVRRAELPFYRRYSGYLGPAFSELGEHR